MSMQPGKAVDESFARSAIGFVFGGCAGLVVWEMTPPDKLWLGLLAVPAGFIAAIGGWLLAGIPYHIMRGRR